MKAGGRGGLFAVAWPLRVCGTQTILIALHAYFGLLRLQNLEDLLVCAVLFLARAPFDFMFDVRATAKHRELALLDDKDLGCFAPLREDILVAIHPLHFGVFQYHAELSLR